jgi:hypothetical protein
LTTGPIQHNSISRLQQEEDIFGSPDGADQKSNGHLSNKLVIDPPNLEEWRQKLFNVDEVITLSEEEYVLFVSKIIDLSNQRCPDLKPIFHMSTMFIPIDQPNATSVNPLFLIIGIVDSRDAHQELQNPMTQTRRSASELPVSGIYAMSRSR